MSDDASQSDSPAENDLVTRVRADGHALAALYDIYYPRVLRYCWRRLGNRAAAEDVTSEVFLSVAGHVVDFSGSTASDFRRWLFRIANNSVSAHLRQALRRGELLKTAVRDGRLSAPEAASELDALDWPVVHAAIAALSEREQAIVSLRFFAGLSHEEIGGVVDASPGAVRTALSRALANLREQLAAAGLLEPEM